MPRAARPPSTRPIDPKAFDDLVALNQFDSDEEFDRLVLEAAASVYTTLAARPDNGGWGPDWEFGLQRFNNSVHIGHQHGSMSSSQPVRPPCSPASAHYPPLATRPFRTVPPGDPPHLPCCAPPPPKHLPLMAEPCA